MNTDERKRSHTKVRSHEEKADGNTPFALCGFVALCEVNSSGYGFLTSRPQPPVIRTRSLQVGFGSFLRGVVSTNGLEIGSTSPLHIPVVGARKRMPLLPCRQGLARVLWLFRHICVYRQLFGSYYR